MYTQVDTEDKSLCIYLYRLWGFVPLYADFYITDFLTGKTWKCQTQACSYYVLQNIKMSYDALTIKEISVALVI